MENKTTKTKNWIAFIPAFIIAYSMILTIAIGCFSSPEYPEAGNPKVVLKWTGLNNNNRIILINTSFPGPSYGFEPTEKQVGEIFAYAQMELYQTKDHQNVSIFFYNGNAPTTIPAQEYTAGGLHPALEYVKSTDPYMTVTIMGVKEYGLGLGFEGF